MRVLVFQGWLDPRRRPPRELLEAWPTLPGMAGALREQGAEVTVVVSAHESAELERDGVLYRFVEERTRLRLRRLLGHRAATHPRRALALARRIPADVVHLHGLSFPLQVRALKRRRPGRPLLAQDHADRPPARWRRPYHRWGLAELDGAAFTHPEQAEPFVRAGLLPPGLPVFGVVEGSTGFRPGPRAEARNGTGIRGAPAVLSVDGLRGGKDPWTLVEGFRRALPDLPDPHLWMIYRRPDALEALRRWLAEHPELEGRVHLLGEVEHRRMEACFRAADVLVTASRREGSGYSVIEALACGTPVVASRIASHRTLLGDPAVGGLFPVGDAGALARHLVHGARGGWPSREAVRAHFEATASWSAVGRSLLDAYRTLLGPGRARP